jgi:hypothetical protein
MKFSALSGELTNKTKQNRTNKKKERKKEKEKLKVQNGVNQLLLVLLPPTPRWIRCRLFLISESS